VDGKRILLFSLLLVQMTTEHHLTEDLFRDADVAGRASGCLLLSFKPLYEVWLSDERSA
jgi:hypothetical protein